MICALGRTHFKTNSPVPVRTDARNLVPNLEKPSVLIQEFKCFLITCRENQAMDLDFYSQLAQYQRGKIVVKLVLAFLEYLSFYMSLFNN